MYWRSRLFIVGILLLHFLFAEAQSTVVFGTVKDASSGETITGCVVVCLQNQKAATTNAYGRYSLSVPTSDSITLKFNFVGFDPMLFRVKPTVGKAIDVSLLPKTSISKEVNISAESNQEKVRSTQMSVETLSATEAKLIPQLLGETDLIRTLQLKPGVRSGSEGNAGLYVRGGGADQNLFLLDEATVYNASHLFGFFSTFNSDAVKDVTLYKGDFPSKYGGRLSSVVDVRLKEGNNKKFGVSGGLGLISSRLTIEGPFVKNKASFIVSGRRTYADLITAQINKLKEGQNGFRPIPDYFFYDLNAKVNWEINPKNKVFLSGYFGRDFFKYTAPNNSFNFNFGWGNTSGTARWNGVINSKLFQNTTFTASDYTYNISNETARLQLKLGSEIRDYALKTDFTYEAGKKWGTFGFGYSIVNHRFDIGRFSLGSSDSTVNIQRGNAYKAWEGGIYFNHDIELTKKLKLNWGLRQSAFYNDSVFYSYPEPRMSVRYLVTDKSSIKLSACRMRQYIHLVSNSGSSIPTDVWYPSDGTVKPQLGSQVAAGYQHNLKKGMLFSIEGYYKWQRNTIDFRDNADLVVNDNLAGEFVFGKGWSYGTEIYLEKKQGKLTGWIGYTLSWAWRQYAEINNGKAFHPGYDRRHDLVVLGMYKLNNRISFSANFVYGTGSPTTLAIGRFLLQDMPGANPFVVPVFGDRNWYRMAANHRLDLGMVYKLKPKKGESDLTFSIYNAYSRRNPYFIYYEEVKDANGNTTRFAPKQVSLFPIIPSITWNFKF